MVDHEPQISLPHERTEFEDVFVNRAVAARDPAAGVDAWQRQMMAAFFLVVRAREG